jgi:hypothetical protein
LAVCEELVGLRNVSRETFIALQAFCGVLVSAHRGFRSAGSFRCLLQLIKLCATQALFDVCYSSSSFALRRLFSVFVTAHLALDKADFPSC